MQFHAIPAFAVLVHPRRRHIPTAEAIRHPRRLMIRPDHPVVARALVVTTNLPAARVGKHKPALLRRGSGTIAGIVAPLLLVILHGDPCVSETKDFVPERLPSAAAQPIEIPFTLYDGYVIVVDAQIGDLQHKRLLLDTGTNPSLIDRNVSTELGLRGSVRDLALFNKSVAAERVTLGSIQIGPIRTKNLQVMVADLSGFAGDLGTRIDGVVGMDVLGANSFTIDYRKKRILFGALAQRHTTPLSSAAQLVTVEVKAGGKTLKLIVDSGTPQLTLFQDRLQDLDSVSTPIIRRGRNLSGTVVCHTIILPSTKIGTDALGPQRASVVTIQKDVPKEFDGLMGLSFLHPTSVSFDFERHVFGWSR